MSKGTEFDESVPDGIVNALYEYDASIGCSNQDGYELLVETFGAGVSGEDLENAGDVDFARLAKNIQGLFGLDEEPSTNDAKAIICKALDQWGG